MLICRAVALIMPSVTVPPNEPSGLPIASTSSPTTRSKLAPMVATVSCLLPASIHRSAISDCSSVPMSVAAYLVPSVSVTTMLSAPLIT